MWAGDESLEFLGDLEFDSICCEMYCWPCWLAREEGAAELGVSTYRFLQRW